MVIKLLYKRHSMLLLLCLISFLSFKVSYSQTQTFNTSGTFTVPVGVTQVTVEAWGGGGKGGTRTTYGVGGGGGGGAYAKKLVTGLIPGNSYTVVVGTGSTTTDPGGDSYFINNTTVLAKGGSSVNNNTPNGAAGGLAGTSIGDVVYSGGNGANGAWPNYGGGGGSSAGTASNGVNATNNNGAIAPAGGGNGGNGATNWGASGLPGNSPGGGGGGAKKWNGGTINGGNGANGKVVISWCSTTFSLTSTTISTPICSGNTTTLTLSNSTASNLPVGTYTVTYNMSGSNVATGVTKTMTITTAGTGSFTSDALNNSGNTTFTITNLASGSCSSPITANNTATVTVNTTPTITGTTPGSRIGTGTVTLGAAASAGTISWYSSPTGGSVLGTGTSFTTPSISTTTTYYVETSNGTCISSRTAVVATVHQPEIDVRGNGNSIIDGDTTPSLTDFTDFDYVEVGVGFTRTYTIYNTAGTASLTIGSITISGVNASDFVVTTPPSASVSPGGNTSFVVTFTPSAIGVRNATISFVNNDPNENPYNFSIQGTGYTLASLCGTTITSFPYTEDFETGIGDWTQDTSDDFDWTRDSGVTPTSSTGPSTASSGNFYMYTEADGNINNTANIVSPCFDLTGTINPRFTFFFHMYGSNTGNLEVEISTNGGLTYSSILWSNSGDVQNSSFSSWIPVSIKLNAYIGQTVKIRIQGVVGSGSRSDIAIDNVSLINKATPTSGPGGISSGLSIWLKANDGLSLSDGQSVSLWENQALGSDARAKVSGQEPTFRNNVSQNVNFNPVVEFDNPYSTYLEDTDFSHNKTTNSQFLIGDYGLYTQEMFIVLIPDDTPITNNFGFMDVFCGDAHLNINSNDATGIGFGYYTGRVSGEIICYAHDTWSESEFGDGYAVAEIGTGSSYDNLGIINTRNHATLAQQELYYNANDIETTQNDIPEWMNTSDTRYFLGRSEGWESSLNARVVEVISYSSRKNDSDLTDERNRIQSYLAIKYGITLGVNGTSQDYVDSDGTVIWDQSANSGFNYDIAGIGRDDASELNQKQSKSINNETDGTGETRGILTIGLTDIYNTNNENITNNITTFNDKQFLVWGNNGIDLELAATTINVNMSAGITPTLNTDVTFIGMQRVWKVVENGGDIPKVKISIPKNAVRNISPPGSYLMFISDTPVFDPTADYRIMVDDGTNLETEYDFDGEKYITFGYAPETLVERSIYFDGVVDYVDMEDALDLNASEFTVSAWIKRGAGSGNTSILSKRNAPSPSTNPENFTEGYDFKLNYSYQLEMSWINGSKQTITGNTSIPEDEWHHVAVIFNNGTANMYIDGVLDKTQASLSSPVNTNQSFYIAAANKNTPTAHYEGNIDEVRIWDIALTEDQLRYIMNQEIEENSTLVNGKILPQTLTKNEVSSIPWTDLAGYYPMSRYTYTNTNDESGNGNQGALRNLDTVDRQTAPLPYESDASGTIDWNLSTTWINGDVQRIPGDVSIIDYTTLVNWNIVKTNHNVTMNNYPLTETPIAGHNNRTLLGLYVNSNKLTVEGGINEGHGLTVTHYLELNGAIDLEGESQLIQSNGCDLIVGSSGYLERDQQGTASSYNYNYWTSSVSPISSSVNSNYTIGGVLMDGTTSSTPKTINFQDSYTAADTGTNNPIIISRYWLWKFNGLNDDYDSWAPIDENSSLLPAEGFTMKGTSGTASITDPQNFVFRGVPYNGDISLPIAAGNDRLIGNPYPSALNAEEFILDNLRIADGGRNTTGNIFNGALYFWHHFAGKTHYLDGYVGGYATYTLMGGAEALATDARINATGAGGGTEPEKFIPVNQGFFVITSLDDVLTGITTINGGNIVFKNSQRAYRKEGTTASNEGSVFFKSNSKKSNQSKSSVEEYKVDERPKIWLQFNSPKGYYRQLLVGVDENASKGFDLGYDGPIADLSSEDMFWLINDSKFVIQGIDNFDKDQEIPIGITVEETGLIKIKIDKLQNISEETEIYIKDNLTGETYLINEQSFEIELEAGEYLDRFSVAFQPRLFTTEEVEVNEGIFTYMNNNTSEFYIRKIVDTEIEKVDLFNYLGQVVHTWNQPSEAREFSLPIKEVTGVYIVQITTTSGIVSKKIVIN